MMLFKAQFFLLVVLLSAILLSRQAGSLPLDSSSSSTSTSSSPPSSSTESSDSFSSSYTSGYGTLRITTKGSITRVVINNPPINLWDYKLASDMSTFVDSLARNSTTDDNTTTTTTTNNNITTTRPNAPPLAKVVIFSSANPEFFIAHYDIHALSLTSPPLPPGNSTTIGAQLIHTERTLTNLPNIISIAEINGRTAGAGNEFAVQCDIRYAGPGAQLSQLEVAFGFEPGSGGVQFLVALIGRARALEYMLTGRSVDAITAEKIGWVNKAFDTTEALRQGVDALAERIAEMPGQGLSAVKQRVNVVGPKVEDLQGDLDLFDKLVPTTVVQEASGNWLRVSEDQTWSRLELFEPELLTEIVPVGA